MYICSQNLLPHVYRQTWSTTSNREGYFNSCCSALNQFRTKKHQRVISTKKEIKISSSKVIILYLHTFVNTAKENESIKKWLLYISKLKWKSTVEATKNLLSNSISLSTLCLTKENKKFLRLNPFSYSKWMSMLM